VPGSSLGPELAALLDNSEGSDIKFKVRFLAIAHATVQQAISWMMQWCNFCSF